MLVDNKPKAYLYKDIPYTKRLIGTKNGFIIKNYISGREKLSFEYRVHLNFNISFFSLVTTLARKKVYRTPSFLSFYLWIPVQTLLAWYMRNFEEQ